MSDPAGLQAAQRLEALGNFEDAYRHYVKLGRKGDAARVAVRLGRPDDAAMLFAEAGMPYESAGLYYQLGKIKLALEQLAYVPHDHPQYRAACVYAIHFANQLDQLEFGVENLIGDFVASQPANEQELNAFLTIAALYERHGMPDEALDALGRVLAAAPSNPHALAAKGRLTGHEKSAAEAAAKNLAADDAFFGRVAEKKPAAAKIGPGAAGAEPPIPVGSGRGDTLFQAGGPPPPTTSMPGPVVGTPVPSPAPGAPPPVIVVAGRYRLEGKIGIGGMAEVWRATDLDVGEEIALKIFQPLSDPAAEERIKAELKLTRRLAHPNVARVYDIGTHEGRRYISMELLKGRDLQGVPKPVAPQQAIEWIAQACEGLHSAHEQGVIHRDVKPENLFLTEQGKVKVMDFGIAKDTEVRRTRAGMMAGTPEFMSPEQINDMSQVTPATDIYSLGIVAYELLTGTIPFSHKELMPLLMMHTKEPPPPMRTRRPELPPALDAAVLMALEKQPTRRPATAVKFAEMLKAALG